jgi:iron complex transport system permease protein
MQPLAVSTNHASPIPPTESIEQPDRTITEMYDIPITPSELGVAHNRVLRLAQIAELPREQRGTLLSLCYDLFVDNWHSIVFGPCIQGAVFELQMAAQPTQFSYLDGYLTVFLEPSPAHMHLCIGRHQGLKNDTPLELAHKRQCKRAAFVRSMGQNCLPGSWSIQLFNGADEQMITFFLPSPFLDMAKEKRLREPNWSHLTLPRRAGRAGASDRSARGRRSRMSSASEVESLPSESALGAPDAVSSRPVPRGLVISASLALLLVVSAALALWIGRGNARDHSLHALFLGMRAYRVGVAFFAGASLAVGGVIVQGLFRNPLASPQILGTNAGALLGGKVALMLTFMVFGGRAVHGLAPEMLVPIGCVLGALLSLFAVLSISSLRASPVTLILTGYVLNSLFGSFGTFLGSLAQESFELHRAMTTFAMGSISGAGMRQVVLAALLAIAGTLPTLLWSDSLDLLLSGEEEALSLGVEVPRVRFWCVVWASLITAGAVAVGGGVGFIGLVIPHAMRRFTGPSHRFLIPASFVAGGAFLILCDALCRAVPLKQEVPLLVLTELIGAPAFLWMLRRLGQESRHA